MRRTSVALAALTGMCGTAIAQSADPVPSIVEAMQTLSGKGAKHRPSGAKGQCYTGTFVPSTDATKLSSASIFQTTSPVLARFSVGGGNPKVADGSKVANRGFSFKIDNGGRGQTEFVMVNAPINFVKSPQQMLGFLQARLPGPDGKPDPEKIKAFAEANPETTGQGKWLANQPIAGSWVGVAYWGIHAYTLTNAAGAQQVIKFKMTPTGGAVGLTDEEAKAKPSEFLVDELAGRLASTTCCSRHGRRLTQFQSVVACDLNAPANRGASAAWYGRSFAKQRRAISRAEQWSAIGDEVYDAPA